MLALGVYVFCVGLECQFIVYGGAEIFVFIDALYFLAIYLEGWRWGARALSEIDQQLLRFAGI